MGLLDDYQNSDNEEEGDEESAADPAGGSPEALGFGAPNCDFGFRSQENSAGNRAI